MQTMVEPAFNSGAERDAALLSWIQQFAPYGVATLDESFNVRSWNCWLEVHSGLKFDDVAGKSLFALFPDLQERKLGTHFERALLGESSVLSSSLHRYLLKLPSPFRETRQPEMLQTARIAPLYSEGEICGIVLVIEDVTQRESQAAELGRQHRRDELLSWALAHLLKTEEPRKAVRQLFFKIAEQLDFDTFIIYLRDAETGQLNLEAVGGVPPEAENEFLACPFVPQLAGEARELIVLNAVQTLQEPQYAALKKARISAVVAIPLVAKDRNLGLLCFASWSRDTIAPEESSLVETIAQYLATRLDRENTNHQLHTAKEQLSDHAQLLEKRVQERTSRLQETVSELETFSYTIAHDLRAPVRGMTGYCDVLLEDFADELPENARGVVQKIARASRRMETLTHDLLEFSKISRQEIVLASVDIEPIIEELAAMRPPAVREAITICSPLHPVLAHRGLLQHVLSNLVDNAVKFVQPNTVPTITISTEVVPYQSPNTRSRSLVFSSTDVAHVSAEPAETLSKRIRIWVSDQGIGIPRAVHQKIFGIFERALASAPYEGTGIGLAIVARAMQRMGGTCGVDSEPGKGSRFWVELPAA
jgi:PAS domain S-box-containing protein